MIEAVTPRGASSEPWHGLVAEPLPCEAPHALDSDALAVLGAIAASAGALRHRAAVVRRPISKRSALS